MKIRSAMAFVLMSIAALGYMSAQATENIEKAPTELLVEFGTSNGELVIVPGTLNLNTGEHYKLVMHNPSPVRHIVSVQEFSETLQNSELEAVGARVRVTYDRPRAFALGPRINSSFPVKEIAMRPDGSAEWYFTPTKAGTYEFNCGIPGHKMAGMTSRVVVN